MARAAGSLVAAILLVPLSAQADLAHRKNAVTEVVRQVSPSVVCIGTTQIVENQFRSPDPFFDQFFGRASGPQKREVQSLGSGVILDPAGTIVTNEHVIHGASSIHVFLADGRQLEAEVVGSDADNDLAVLKVNSKTPLQFAPLGTSADLMIGETAIAIGAPFGLQKTVTLGVISATGRSVRAENHTYNDFVQTDASINPGNSGGPLLNVDGEVIAINAAIYAQGQGIGFAIPADKVRRIVTELARFGKVRPAWIGLEVQRLTPDLAAKLGWDRDYGVLVNEVEAGSPADKGGIHKGDLVSDVGGNAVADDDDFDARMRSYPAKTDVSMTVVREGKPMPVTFTAVEYPATLSASLDWDRLGLRFEVVAGGALNINQIRAGYPGARAGLVKGDLLLRVNNTPVPTINDLRDTLVAARATHSVLLLVKRGRYLYNLTVPLQRG